MTDLSDYFSDKDEIARLNKQINMIAGFYKSIYEAKEKSLNKRLDSLITREYRTNKILLNSNINMSGDRSRKAVKLIKIGKMSFREIASTCYLGYSTVKQLSCKVNKLEL